jgi:hypothetical protein
MAFELDIDGGAEVLTEMAQPLILEIALQVAEAADEGATVDEYAQVEEKVTDRAKALVSVPAERQAKDGVLTRAAAAAGLEVRLLPQRTRAARKSKSKSKSKSGKGETGDAASDS